MACKLSSRTNNGNCRKANGGVYKAYIAETDDIVDVIYDPTGIITNFVMSSLGKWFEYEFDLIDDTAYYNQTQTRTGTATSVDQVGFMKFGGLGNDVVDFANGISACCSLTVIWFLNSGPRFVQGLDVDLDENIWLKSKKYCVANVNILTDTGKNEDRLEITFNSTGRFFSAPTTLTAAAIEAL